MNRPAVLLALLSLACAPTEPSSEQAAAPPVCGDVPTWTFDESAVYPVDQSLTRVEDGRALPDGRLVVADEAYGLRIVETDGSSRPFPGFAEAGYRHDPPGLPGGANGVFLEDDGRHVLVSDVYTGTIYRVDTESEAVTVVYDHPYGINAVVRDRLGTIWFSQSTTNTPESGVGGVFGAIDRPINTGAVFALRASGDGFAEDAEEVATGLYFANGIAFGPSQEHLYVAETMMDRVLRYRVDLESASLSDRETHATVHTPDNVAVDARNRVWVASPGANQIVMVDASCRAQYTVFDAPSATNRAGVDEWVRRSRLGEPLLELFTPELWAPLPGPVTGMFWSADGGTFYITGLGNALLRHEMP
jgi:sugar lactone lactonase YvrE